MESWRQELYNTLSHSVEGSTWQDHKYIAIVDGKYIYPEDVQKSNNSSGSSTTGSTTGSATKETSSTGNTATVTTTTKSGKKVKVNITLTDKGSVDSYKDLPTDPSIGDMYYLKNKKQKVYWTGKIWTPVIETSETTSTDSSTSDSSSSSSYSSGSSKKKDSSKSEVSKSTVERAKSAYVKKDHWTVKLNPDSGVSSAAKSSQASKGKSYVGSALKTAAKKVVSAVKTTKVYQAGKNLFNKLFGGSKKSSGGGR